MFRKIHKISSDQCVPTINLDSTDGDHAGSSKSEENDKEESPVAKVKKKPTPLETFLDRVTLGGLKNLRDATKPWERRFWIFSISTGFIFAIYHIASYLDNVKEDNRLIAVDIKPYFDMKSIPAPNVTICSQILINSTFVKEKMFISPNVRKKLSKYGNYSLEILYEQLILYLALTTRPKNLDPVLEPILGQVVYENANLMNDFMRFTTDALPSCEQSIENCSFDSKSFNCCDVVKRSHFDTGVCFKLPFNKGNGDGVDIKRAGEKGGLTLDAVIDLKHVPFMDDTLTDGFIVFASHTSSLMESPIVVATGMHVHIRVEPITRNLRNSCFQRPPVLENSDDYDPNGFKCVGSHLNDLLYRALGCMLPNQLYLPNASVVCHPQQFRTFFSVLTGDYSDRLSKYAKMLQRQDLTSGQLQRKMIMGTYDKKCLPLCQKWEYTSYVGYSTLILPNDKPQDQYKRRSRISVYYGSMDYEEHRERPLLSPYFIFCQIGGLLEFYASASVVTVMQLMAYGLWCLCKAIYDANRKRGTLHDDTVNGNTRRTKTIVAWENIESTWNKAYGKCKILNRNKDRVMVIKAKRKPVGGKDRKTSYIPSLE